MDLKALKALAEKFRAVADDKAAVKKLADESCAANKDDDDCEDLCTRVVAAANGAAVRAVIDEVKARS